MQDKTEFRLQLDTPKPVQLSPHEWYLEGWCVSLHEATRIPKLVLLVDGLSCSVTMGRARPDVAAALNNPSLAGCGFIVRFRPPLADPVVKLIAQTESGDVPLTEIVCDLNPDSSARVRERLPGTSAYQEWLRIKEPIFFWTQEEIESRISSFTYRPLISVILRTLDTHLPYLQRCIRSVRQQRYCNWELCVADDCSSDPRILEYLKTVATEDVRIQLTERTSQGGMSAALNMALHSSKGSFIVCLDHEDELHPSALLEVVRYLNRDETVVLVYSDHDEIDELGTRSRPTFKPDFDLEMFLSYNYIEHLFAVRRNLVFRCGGFRSECDGAQYWDLLVRAVEEIGPSEVHHIQKPLYHRRFRENLSPAGPDADKQNRTALIRVVAEHLERTDKRASAAPGLMRDSIRVKYPLSSDVRIAVVLRVEDGPFQISSLAAGIADIAGGRASFYEISGCCLHPTILRFSAIQRYIEPAPSQSPRDAEEDDCNVRTQSSPLLSLCEMPEDVFVFVNSPVEVVNHTLFEELAAQALRADCGLVTGISIDSNGRTTHTGLIQAEGGRMIDPYAGLVFPRPGHLGPLGAIRQVEGISEDFFAVRREHLASVGGLGAVSGAGMARLARRLAKNAKCHSLKVLVTPYAVVTFAQVSPRVPSEPIGDTRASGLNVNSNLTSFENLDKT
jgi:hypothetical protein